MSTFSYPSYGAFGTSYTGQGTNVGYRVIDAAGTSRIARTTSGITERVDAAGNATTGTYTALLTLDTTWAYPLREVWDITGQAGVVAEGIISVATLLQFDSSANVKATPQTTVTLAATQAFNNTGQTTNVPSVVNSMATDSLSAAALSAGAVNKGQNGLALDSTVAKELTLTSAQTALASAISAIQNNTSTRLVVPPLMELPDTGSTVYELDLLIYDETGNMEAPDSLPTITARNPSGTDRSANLGAVTLVSTGRYKALYTLASSAPIEQLLFEATVVEGGASRTIISSANIVNEDITNMAAQVNTIFSNYATTGNVATLVTAINALNNLSTTQVATAVQTGMTAQGYTTTRAGYLDTLNGLVTNIWGATTRTLSAFGFMADYARRTGDYATSTNVADALNAYDPPTRTEATADKDEVLAKIEDIEFPDAPTVPTPQQVADAVWADSDGETVVEGVTSIKGHFDAALEEGEPGAVISAPSTPTKATVRVRTKDFAGVNLITPVTLTLDEPDSTTVVIAGVFRGNRSFSGVTSLHTDGEGNVDAYIDLQVWHKNTLAAENLKTTYKLSVVGASNYHIEVPPEGGLASTPSWKKTVA